MLNKVDRLDNLEKLRNKLEKVKILNKKTCLDLYFLYWFCLHSGRKNSSGRLGIKKSI